MKGKMKYFLRIESQGMRTRKNRSESLTLPNTWRMVVEAENDKEALQKAFSKREPNPFRFKNNTVEYTEKFDMEIKEGSGCEHHNDTRVFDVLIDIKRYERFWPYVYTVEMSKLKDTPFVDKNIEEGCTITIFKEYDREAAKKEDEEFEKMWKEREGKNLGRWMLC